MKNIKKIDIHAHAVAFPQYVPNCFPGGHSSPLRLEILSLIWNQHPNKRLPCLKGGGPSKTVEGFWNLMIGKNP